MTTEERNKLIAKYNTYLLGGIFGSIDEITDMEPPMTFKEFCKREIHHER
jgi:hypothetical protein